MIDVAVIGMSCRFPGANNVDTFWNNLVQGVESIRTFTKEELRAANVSEELLNNPQYVPAKGILDDIEYFDANFFGYNPTDAKITDPQQRIFFECAWEALETAGCIPEKYKGLIGVYASMADSLYLQNNILKNKNFSETLDWFQTRIGTSITTLSTQLSYRLNLQGSSINITTACSSSIVAIATACRALVDYDCDVAIAGASAIAVPQKSGYLFQTDGIESSDSHCRAFDRDAEGTVFSNGVGVVILKRLEDAIRDSDPIQAVIKGWSINNDGSEKIGFTAPSVIGQAKCVSAAFDFSEIHPDSLSYLEAHGTGTILGDVIELDALEKAFRQQSSEKQFCAIGSVKTNIGHTDIAAGMASFIKTVLALKNKIIPPTLHYQNPNPKIDFPNTPFFVNSAIKKWDFGMLPRRAGINSSGIGGTNAFLILEEFKAHKTEDNQHLKLLLLSAKTKSALEKMTHNLIQTLDTTNTYNLADVAFTLQVGRADFNYRRMLIATNTNEALSKLKKLSHDSVFNKHHTSVPKVVFMFSGQGTQYVGMGKALYSLEPVFKEWIDHCCEYLEEDLKHAVQNLIFQSSDNDEASYNTAIAQPALFIIEYSFAKLLMGLDIKPDAMIGHSIGEYVAASLAGVMTLENALKLVCYRAKLMATTRSGVMLAVHMAEHELPAFLSSETVSIAAINSNTSCVISGEHKTIEIIEQKLKKANIMHRRLRTAHAFHSHMMDPILEDFHRVLETVELHPLSTPFISNVTGDWINVTEATSPDYWTRHLRGSVQFLAGLKTLVDNGANIFIEIGAGKTLCRFVQEFIKKNPNICVTNTMPSANDEALSAEESLAMALGQLWLHGVQINWANYHKHTMRQKLVLPTYPFERQVYWIEPDDTENNQNKYKKQPYPKWFYEPSWVRTSLFDLQGQFPNIFRVPSCWLLFLDNEGVGHNIATMLLQHKHMVITVQQGSDFAVLSNQAYTIDFTKKEDYQKLVYSLCKITNLPLKVINLFALTSEHNINNLDLKEVKKNLYLCFYSSLFFVQALIEQQYEQQINILHVGNEIYSVVGSEKIYPVKATVTGVCRVIPQEHPHFKMRVLDVVLSEIKGKYKHFMSQQIISALLAEHENAENIIAYRGQFQWTQVFQSLKCKTEMDFTLRPGGVYVLTGGLGGISLTIAKLIAQSSKNPHLILLSRSSFPQQRDWKTWITEHEEKDKTRKKILHLEEIKNLGAHLTIMQSDVVDFEQLNLTIENIRKTFGCIHGVIHAAGIAGGGLVQLKTEEMANKVLAPKVDGTYILTYLLRDEPLDFFVLCSSVSAIIGELSQVDYCAANACLDAFGYTTAFNKTPLTVINWNTWREIGMAVETDRPEDVTYFDRNNDISPAEGARIFSDLLGHHCKQAIISTFDINAYIGLMAQNKEANSVMVIERHKVLNDEAEINYVPPSNDIELALVNIWQHILGIEKIGILDDFFELGGHSLMALRMLTKIQEKLNIKISLQVLQEAKVIQVLAKKIQNLSSKNNFSSLVVPLRAEGRQKPLFCLHPVGGTIFCYLPLAKYLKFECPIYGIQDPSFENGKLLFKTLEQMAACYIEAIQKVQARGPYLLCGLSFGATLVVEIAQQLRAKGEKLKPLILFDGWAKFSNYQRIEKVFKKSMLNENKSNAVDQAFIELSWERMKLLLNYEISDIQEKMILFKAEESLAEYSQIPHPQNHWSNYAKNGIETYIISGNHDTMLEEPNILALAKKLDFILKALESKLIPEKDLL